MLARIKSALTEGSSWAAIGAVLGTTATQVGAPESIYFYIAGGGAAVLAILLKDKGA